jgi:hypothetical protein
MATTTTTTTAATTTPKLVSAGATTAVSTATSTSAAMWTTPATTAAAWGESVPGSSGTGALRSAVISSSGAPLPATTAASGTAVVSTVAEGESHSAVTYALSADTEALLERADLSTATRLAERHVTLAVAVTLRQDVQGNNSAWQAIKQVVTAGQLQAIVESGRALAQLLDGKLAVAYSEVNLRQQRLDLWAGVIHDIEKQLSGRLPSLGAPPEQLQLYFKWQHIQNELKEKKRAEEALSDEFLHLREELLQARSSNLEYIKELEATVPVATASSSTVDPAANAYRSSGYGTLSCSCQGGSAISDLGL